MIALEITIEESGEVPSQPVMFDKIALDFNAGKVNEITFVVRDNFLSADVLRQNLFNFFRGVCALPNNTTIVGSQTRGDLLAPMSELT
jgi:hypothetical protein